MCIRDSDNDDDDSLPIDLTDSFPVRFAAGIGKNFCNAGKVRSADLCRFHIGIILNEGMINATKAEACGE